MRNGRLKWIPASDNLEHLANLTEAELSLCPLENAMGATFWPKRRENRDNSGMIVNNEILTTIDLTVTHKECDSQ